MIPSASIALLAKSPEKASGVLYRIGADLVLLAHFLFAAFAVFGGMLLSAGNFVQRYFGPVVYPRGMPRQLELIAGVSVVGGNVLVYAIVFWFMR